MEEKGKIKNERRKCWFKVCFHLINKKLQEKFFNHINLKEFYL
jgi:hypothetical protein